MTHGVSGVVGHAAQTVVLMLHAGRSGHSCYPALGGSQRIRWGTPPGKLGYPKQGSIPATSRYAHGPVPGDRVRIPDDAP
jgi:hypothetical protein